MWLESAQHGDFSKTGYSHSNLPTFIFVSELCIVFFLVILCYRLISTKLLLAAIVGEIQ